MNEIRKYESEIIKRAGYTKGDFELLFDIVTKDIEIVDKEKYVDKLQEADHLIGGNDKGDIPFLALALSTPNDGIWTQNIKHFRQSKVRVWTTKEVLETFKRINQLD